MDAYAFCIFGVQRRDALAGKDILDFSETGIVCGDRHFAAFVSLDNNGIVQPWTTV